MKKWYIRYIFNNHYIQKQNHDKSFKPHDKYHCYIDQVSDLKVVFIY